MKRVLCRLVSLTSMLALILALSLGAYAVPADTENITSSDATKEYYLSTDPVELETFTSIIGIELNIAEDAPESKSGDVHEMRYQDYAEPEKSRVQSMTVRENHGEYQQTHQIRL